MLRQRNSVEGGRSPVLCTSFFPGGNSVCACNQLHLFSGKRPIVLLPANWDFIYSYLSWREQLSGQTRYLQSYPQYTRPINDKIASHISPWQHSEEHCALKRKCRNYNMRSCRPSIPSSCYLCDRIVCGCW